MEPEWTKQIPSTTVCNFFYLFFVIYAILFALAVLGFFAVVMNFKKLGAGGLAMAFQGLLVGALTGTTMLFYYLICDRALLATKQEAAPRKQISGY